MAGFYRSSDIAKEVNRTFLSIAKKSNGNAKTFAQKMFLDENGNTDWDEMAEFFAICDRLITVMMQNSLYTDQTIDAACKIIFMLAAANPTKYADPKALPDADSESIADPAKAYYRLKYSVFHNYLTSPDDLEREIAEDDLRGYMLSIEREINDVINMCDNALADEEYYLDH